MKKTKKAQAAMEFLMTYGWAILVVLAGIGALAYFGVLSPGKFIPETCTMPPTSGLACIDFKVTPTTAHLLLVNGGGRDLYLYNITIGDCQAEIDMEMVENKQQLINLTGCSYGKKGEKFKQNIDIIYSFKGSELPKTAQGSIVANIDQ